MNDLDRLAVMLHQLLMHLETEIDEEAENAGRIAQQMPTPDSVQRWRDLLQRRQVFNQISRRVISVLDFFRGGDV